MSTVKLLKDCEGIGRAGETVSVPFVRGRELVNAKLASYLAGPVPPSPAKPNTADLRVQELRARADAEIAALKAQCASDAAECERLRQLLGEVTAERDALKADLDAMTKPKK